MNDWKSDWLAWYESLQPLVFSDEERKAWEQERKARKEWELANAAERDRKLKGLWE